MLEAKVASGIPYEQAFAQSMTNASAAAKEHAIATKGAAGSTDVFVAKQKVAQAELKATATAAKSTSTAMKALSIAGNMLLFTAITAGISLLTKAIDDYVHRLDNAKDALEETQSELESINSEIDTTTSKIKELEALDPSSLSITDKEDLQRLKDQNEELRIRQQYLDQQAQQEAKKVADLTKEKYGLKYKSSTREEIDAYKELYEKPETQRKPASSYLSGDSATESTPYAPGLQNKELMKGSNSLASLIAQYEYFEEQKKKAVQNKDSEEIEKYNKKLEETAQKLRDDRTELQGFADDLSATGESSPELDDINNKLSLIDNTLLTKGQNLVNFINSDEIKEDKEKLVVLANSGKLTAEELSENFGVVDNYLKENGLTIEDLISVIRTYKDELSSMPTDKTSILSFDKVWNSEDFADAKKELISLAEAGQLTPETLQSTEEYKKLLDQTGMSAEEAAKKINSMVDASTQLNSLSGQISKMADMLADKKNGTTASANDLAGFDATVKGLESWDEFEKVMGSSKSSMEECQAAANALATEWINNGNYLANLTEENKNYYITQLNNMGIENAEAIVTDTLTQKKTSLALATQFAEEKGKDLSNATVDEINKFVEEHKIATETRNALYRLALAKQGVNAATLSFDGDIANIKKYVEALGGAAYALSMMERIKNNPSASIPSDVRNQILKQAQIEVSTVTNTPAEIDLSDFGSSTYKGGSSKSSGGGSSKDSKQKIDWISRLLDVLQKKIDTTKSKFDNLFTLKDKKNNLAKQLSLTKSLLTATEKSANRYKKAADKVKLSSDLKKKVRNGSYDINEYNSDAANAINTYKEYYDQYIDLLKEEEVLRKDIRDIEIQGYQLDADNASAKLAKSQALAELDEGNFKKQNKHLEAQKKYLREQYEAQIKIAEAEGNTLEVERLRAELQKELRDNTMEQFNNIDETYSMKIGHTDNKVKAFQDQISLLEARGEKVGSRLYTKQMELNQVNINRLQKEYKDQLTEVAKFKFGTPEWYKAQDAIANTTSEIVNYQIEQANLQKSINQLKFDRFDDLLAKLNDIVDETDFLIDMLDSENFFDDNGKITDDGITAMGMYAQKRDIYKSEAEKYRQMQAELEKDYQRGAVDPKTYEAKMREYKSGEMEMTKAAEDMNKSIINLVSDGLEKQNQALSESIQKQKDLLRAEKDLKSFQDSLNDANKNVSRLERQYEILSGDDSEENRKRLREIKSQLEDAKKSRDDLLYDKSIEDQEKNLDNMYDAAVKSSEEYLKDSAKVLIDACGIVNVNTETVSKNIERISKETGVDISENITNAWKQSGNAVSNFGTTVSSTMSGVLGQISLVTEQMRQLVEESEKAANAIASDTISTYKNVEKSDGITAILKTGSNKNPTSDLAKAVQSAYGTGLTKGEMYQISSLLNLGYKKEDFYDNSPIRNKAKNAVLQELVNKGYLKKSKSGYIKGYAKGGIIDPHDILKRTGEDGFIIANQDEAVLTEPQWQSIRDLGIALTNLNQQIYKPYIPEFQTRNAQSPVYNIDNSITVEGVATDKIVKDMEGVAKKQAENVITEINRRTYAKGVRWK